MPDKALIAQTKNLIDSNYNGLQSARYEYELEGYMYFIARDKLSNHPIIVRVEAENFATVHEYRKLWQKSWYELYSGEKYPNR